MERTDPKAIQFIIGSVRYRRTLMHDEQECPRNPLEEWLSFRRYHRHSLFVEVKTVELASGSTYREYPFFERVKSC